VPQSSELAGGVGFTFQDVVSATYLTALLQEGYAAGIENRTVSRVAQQQRDFGEPLDDVIVDFRAADGELARLSLQVKRSLTISRARTNTDFQDIIRDSWNTLKKPGFRTGIDRYGAAVGEVASHKERALRTLCETARASIDAEDFEARFESSGNANALVRRIRDDITTIVERQTGAAPSAAAMHQFFAHFVLIQFDYLHEGGTSLPTALNAVRTCLAAGHETDAPAAWVAICQLAREQAGNSGVFERPQLVRELSSKVHLAAAPSLRADLDKIRSLATQWLADIEDDIGLVQLERPNLARELQAKLDGARVVQIKGMPGSGKSVLLRRHLEARLEVGPTLFLKSGRLEGVGWASFAHANDLSAARLENLLVEIGATGSDILYIDGIDRVEKQHQPIIRDVVRTILGSALLTDWRIIVTLRDTGIEPLRNWIGELVAPEGLETVEVGELDDGEAERLAQAKPHLRGLLFGPSPVLEIVRRPFFAKVLEQSFGATVGSPSFSPQSEVDLIGNWWMRGGYNADGQAIIERQRALVELGLLRARHVEREIAISQLTQPTVSLVRQFMVDGILQDARLGHTVRFAHDIFFEWAFLHVLEDRGSAWLEEIRLCGEPPAISRVVELLSQSEFGKGPGWVSTLRHVEASGMRSQWTRAWLLGPLATPDFNRHEALFSDAVKANEFHFLRKALVWFQAEKTTPNPIILAGNLAHDERIRIADILSWPSDYAAWQRFIAYLLARIPTIPAALFPDVLSVFEVWLNALGGKGSLSHAIMDQVASWLTEINEGDDSEPSRRAVGWRSFGVDLNNFRNSLIGNILRCSPQRPDLSRSFLKRVIASENLRDQEYSEISVLSRNVVLSHPDLLVDLTLKHLKTELPKDQQNREQQEACQQAEYRNRILAEPPEKRTKKEQTVSNRSFSPLAVHWFSYHDWRELSINRGTQDFYPPSPLREPFRSLFMSTPDEGLRLIRELSNHAIAAWRQLHELVADSPGTPLPLEIRFPWGVQSFWGGDREYLWHRGMWAPDPIACGYMALEDWALSELKRGRSADELIQQIVPGNECIAILGAAAAVSLQAEAVSETVFPLVTSQRLLIADRNRMLSDLTDAVANLIGFRSKSDLPHYEAVKAGNARNIRKKSLPLLLFKYYLAGGSELSGRVRAAVLSFPNNLPYQIKEHRNSQEVRDRLLAEAGELAELVELENYRCVGSTGDDEQVGIIHVSPTASSPQRIEEAKEAAKRLREGSLWMWAGKYFETGEMDSQFTVPTAIAFAQELDSSDLYEMEGDGIDDQRRGAVAAAAAIALNCRKAAAGADIEWARDVVDRATHAPDRPDLLAAPLSAIPWHNGIFAAHGLAGELRQGTPEPNIARNLLTLITHPLECVSLAAVREALSLWDVDPRLGWSALFVAFSLCHVARLQVSGPGESLPTTDRARMILDTALEHYSKSENWPKLPLPPPAWIKLESMDGPGPWRHFLDGDRVRDDDLVNSSERWGEPPTFWRSKYASAVLAAVPIAKVLASAAGPTFLSFMSDLLVWTVAKISPPWMKPGRRRHGSSHLYEWIDRLGRTLGTEVGFLHLDRVKASIFEPIFVLEDECCWDLLAPLADTYIRFHVYDASRVPEDALELLRLCLERLLKEPAFDPSTYHAGELHGFDLPRLADALMFVAVEHAGKSERYVNGDWSDIGRILPIIDRFVRAAGWSSSIMSRYLTLCERSKTAYPADLFADQVLDVIDRQTAHLKGWHGTLLPARIAGLVQHFADRQTPMAPMLAQKLLRILDLLVDMGNRRSAALQLSESFREVQTG